MRKNRLTPLILILTLAAAPGALAGEHHSDKGKTQMPVSGGASFAEAASFKKLLDDSMREPSLGEKASQAAYAALQKATGFFSSKGREESLRGDPATEFDQAENALHSSRRAPASSETRLPNEGQPLMLRKYVSARTIEFEDTILGIYEYDVSETLPYDTIRVVYDKETRKVLSAAGYTTTFSDSVPDLSSYTLANSAVRSDGSLASEIYESVDSDGVLTLIRIDYDPSGSVYVRQTVIEPIDNAILPRI